MIRNYLLLLNALLKKRKWQSEVLWKMLEMIAEELHSNNIDSVQVFKEIYKYATKCKTYTELEDYLDKFTY
jgi:hypothetical protein